MNWPTYLFYETALKTVPRILGFCNRDINSDTYGCCDRNYWKYKIIDFPNARFQESGLLFALAYTSKLPGNYFYQKEKMAIWSRQVWRFWLSKRNKDGSTNEVYPNEHSFCSTAFTTAAFLETVKLLGGSDQWKDELRASLSTLDWLSNHQNREVGNQMAASLWALTAYAHLSGNQIDWGLVNKRKTQLLALALPDGTLPEYGGFDPGYQSISLSALARTRTLGLHDSSIDNLFHNGIVLLEERLQQTSTEYTSQNTRGTQYLFPYGLSLNQGPLLKKLARGLNDNKILHPTWMDDRYCIAMTTDYWMAGMELVYANDN